VSANANANANKTSPFRATAVERYTRQRETAVSVRRPPGALLVGLWVLLLVTLALGGAWLTVAWRYLVG
jgi:fatty acid desaturase